MAKNEGDVRENAHHAHQYRSEQAKELMRKAGYVPVDPNDPDCPWVRAADAPNGS